MNNNTWREFQENSEKTDYIASKEICLAVQHAFILRKPILIEGPAGVGKTELAKALASIFATDMIRLQCSPEITERKALYDYDYAKQLLFIQMLKDDITEETKETETLLEKVAYLEKNNPFFSETFLIKRPILQAFVPKDGKQKVLLIDELDKADAEFEYSLLESFSDYTVSIPELGTITATKSPLTIITSNRARKISDTFLRRCIYIYIDYPTMQQETKIIQEKLKCNQALAQQIATVVQEIRSHPSIAQNPSIAESIEWAQVLSLHIEDETATKQELQETIHIIAKNPNDRKKIAQLL